MALHRLQQTPQFKNSPLGCYWVGSSHVICNRFGCTCTPKKGTKHFDGTPVQGNPVSAPSQRTPAQAAKREAELQKKLADSDKEKAELQKQLAAGSGGAAAAPAAPAAANSTVASGTNQASAP